MCGGQANLVLVAPCCTPLWAERTCFGRGVLLVPLGTIGLEVVHDFGIVCQISWRDKSPVKSDRQTCHPEMDGNETVGPARAQARKGRQ